MHCFEWKRDVEHVQKDLMSGGVWKGAKEGWSLERPVEKQGQHRNLEWRFSEAIDVLGLRNVQHREFSVSILRILEMEKN